MSLTKKQKRYIKKYQQTKSVDQIIRDLNVSKKELDSYYIKKNNSTIKNITHSYSLRVYLKRIYLHIIGLTLLCIFAFINGWGGDFVSDDIPAIKDSAVIGSASYIFHEPMIFMRTFLYYLVHLIFGKSPVGYHLLNTGFHVGNVILVFLILSLSVNTIVAFITASLFVIHPITVESVTWISGGIYPQYVFFLLLSLFSLIIFLKKNNIWWYFLSIGISLLGYLSSEKALIYPFIVLLFLYCFSQMRQTVKWIMGYFISVIPWVLYFVSKFSGRISAVSKELYVPDVSVNFFEQFPIAISKYIELLLLPFNLSFYHTDFVVDPVTLFLQYAVLFILLGVMVVSFRYNKILFFALALFFISLSPTLTPFGISSVVAERYVYFGSWGMMLIVGYGLWWITEKYRRFETILYILFFFILIFLFVRTIIRNRDFRNEDVLWSKTVQTARLSPVAHMNMGDVYRRNKMYVQAEQEFMTAIRLNPQYAYAYYNLGLSYQEAGAYEAAIGAYRAALQIDPGLWQAHQNMGVAFMIQKNYQAAIQEFKDAITINDTYFPLYSNLAAVYYLNGDDELAEQSMQKAVSFGDDPQRIQAIIQSLQ